VLIYDPPALAVSAVWHAPPRCAHARRAWGATTARVRHSQRAHAEVLGARKTRARTQRWARQAARKAARRPGGRTRAALPGAQVRRVSRSDYPCAAGVAVPAHVAASGAHACAHGVRVCCAATRRAYREPLTRALARCRCMLAGAVLRLHKARRAAAGAGALICARMRPFWGLAPATPAWRSGAARLRCARSTRGRASCCWRTS
jgi:hypothetical protein